MKYLLVDVGNSRIKWCWCENGILSYCGYSSRNQYEYVNTLRSLTITRRPARVFVCSVLNQDENHKLNKIFDDAVLPERIWITKVSETSKKISTLYADPDSLGIDRYLAICAAFEEYNSAAIVIDAGTATTIDVISQEGVHLGGVIIPGLRILTTCLGLSVSRLSAVDYLEQDDEIDGFQISTSGCVNQGVRYAWLGGISSAINSMKEKLPDSTRLILTGGDADSLQNNLHEDVILRPNLVLEGLSLQMGVV